MVNYGKLTLTWFKRKAKPFVGNYDDSKEMGKYFSLNVLLTYVCQMGILSTLK